ncbi:Uncharacterised protein [Mycobacteroides abscessus subsp. abscessus]|nr:Uncharacterised protein [Mycobacteroides abscessus subsp. abscessus]
MSSCDHRDDAGRNARWTDGNSDAASSVQPDANTAPASSTTNVKGPVGVATVAWAADDSAPENSAADDSAAGA